MRVRSRAFCKENIWYYAKRSDICLQDNLVVEGNTMRQAVKIIDEMMYSSTVYIVHEQHDERSVVVYEKRCIDVVSGFRFR